MRHRSMRPPKAASFRSMMLKHFGKPGPLAGRRFELASKRIQVTHAHTEVALTAFAERDHILIEVRDNCGGLPPGAAERMFNPFVQVGDNKSGLGLGLSIARRDVEADGGALTVRDVPGTGCVFTIKLPRRTLD
ncbi:sensor histidine kinase [Variovorax brevis]|uniref:sensor histidine kinase n=1 Tax=Variovorax brevis TaxID=3053503 RepID=UPI00336543C6